MTFYAISAMPCYPSTERRLATLIGSSKKQALCVASDLPCMVIGISMDSFWAQKLPL